MADNITKIIRAVKQSDLIVTPPLTRFLLANGNLTLDADIAKIIHDLLVKQPRERSKSFSGSSAGRCQRRQIFEFQGIDPGGVIDPQLQMIFYDGTWRHLRWQAVLLEAGILSQIEVPLDWPAMRSMGSMDGAGVVPDNHPKEGWRGLEFGFELKGMNTYAYQKVGEAKEDHLNQVHRYFLAGGFDLFVIIYEDKNTQAWTEWVIEPDPARIDAQRAELEALNYAVDNQSIPQPLPDCAMQRGETFRQCPFGGKNGICVMQGEQWPEPRRSKP